MTQLQQKNLSHVFAVAKIPLEMKIALFLEALANFFSNSCYGELSGFYTQGYPASSKHMFWHVKCRGTNEPHREPWHTDSERQLMESYIARHKDEYPLWLLEEHRKETPLQLPRPLSSYPRT